MSTNFQVRSVTSEMSDDMRGVHGAWRGGPCPQCGDEMPANVVHCQTCRFLLNAELKEDSIQIPEFRPLPEIRHIKPVDIRGHYISCPGCSEELRINKKYLQASVQCRHCQHPFVYDTTVTQEAVYGTCPHCSEEIRAGLKYVGQKVACRFCEGALQL